jgi:hypothetical protein
MTPIHPTTSRSLRVALHPGGRYVTDDAATRCGSGDEVRSQPGNGDQPGDVEPPFTWPHAELRLDFLAVARSALRRPHRPDLLISHAPGPAAPPGTSGSPRSTLRRSSPTGSRSSRSRRCGL